MKSNVEKNKRFNPKKKLPKNIEVAQNNNHQNSLLSNNIIKYFAINTADSEKGGQQFYLATQEEIPPQKFDPKIINTISNLNYRTQIIPQKSIMLQINKPNLNNIKSEEKLKIENISKKSCIKKFNIKKNVKNSKNIKNTKTTKNTKNIKSAKKTERIENFLDIYKLKVNTKILEKLNKEQYEKFNKYNSPILEAAVEKNKNLNNNENNLKNDNVTKINHVRPNRSLDLLSRSSNILEEDFINRFKSAKRKNSLEKAMDKLERFKTYGILTNPKKLYNSFSFKTQKQKKNLYPGKIINNKKKIIYPGYYIKKTVIEEHFYIDENGNEKLLNVNETIKAEPDKKNIIKTNSDSTVKTMKIIKDKDIMTKNEDENNIRDNKNIIRYSVNSYVKKNKNMVSEIGIKNSNSKPKSKLNNRQNHNKIILNNIENNNTNNNTNNNISYNNTDYNIRNANFDDNIKYNTNYINFNNSTISNNNQVYNNNICISANNISINPNKKIKYVNYNEMKKYITTDKNQQNNNFSNQRKNFNSINYDINKNNRISINNLKNNRVNKIFITRHSPNNYNDNIKNNINDNFNNLTHVSYQSEGSIKLKKKFTNQKLGGYIEKKVEKFNNYGYHEICYSKNSKKKYDIEMLSTKKNDKKSEKNLKNERFIYHYGGMWGNNKNKSNYSSTEKDNFNFHESKPIIKSIINQIHSSNSVNEYVFPNLRQKEKNLGFNQLNEDKNKTEINRNMKNGLKKNKNFKTGIISSL